MNAREITSALKGRWHGRYGMVCCPAHKDRTPSCKISDGDQRPVFHCFAGCHWKDVVHAVEDMGLLPKWEPNRKSKPVETISKQEPKFTRKHPDVMKKRKWAWRIWCEAEKIQRTLGEQYFISRGITIRLPGCIRFHKGLKDNSTGNVWPAIVIAYTSYEGDFDGIQRIFIDPLTAKKASISNAKLSLGTFPGGMMRFADIERPNDNQPFYGELGICEGPEDALSITQMFDVPVWSAGAGEKMALANLPSPLDALYIYCDNGSAGKRLADKALNAHVDKVRKKDAVPQIFKIWPEQQFGDFNDRLQTMGNAA